MALPDNRLGGNPYGVGKEEDQGLLKRNWKLWEGRGLSGRGPVLHLGAKEFNPGSLK